MSTYTAPLRDMQFVVHDLLNFEKHCRSLPDCDEVNQELIDSILGAADKYSEEVVAPLNVVGTPNRETNGTADVSRSIYPGFLRGAAQTMSTGPDPLMKMDADQFMFQAGLYPMRNEDNHDLFGKGDNGSGN